MPTEDSRVSARGHVQWPCDQAPPERQREPSPEAGHCNGCGAMWSDLATFRNHHCRAETRDAYRRGREQGRREGLEEAAKVTAAGLPCCCESDGQRGHYPLCHQHHRETYAATLRAVAAQPRVL